MADGGDDEGVSSSDRWALWYISANYVRSILEAFDEDLSGFITVKEANSFTRSRPLGWRWVFGNPYLARPAHVCQPSALVSVLGHW